MEKKKQNELISVLLLFICILVLASYYFVPELLMKPIGFLFGIPIGNLITAIGFIAASLLTFYMPGSENRYSLQKNILLVLSILWLPVSIFLSGNVNIGFDRDSQTEMQIWLVYTIFTALSIFILLILLRIRKHSTKR